MNISYSSKMFARKPTANRLSSAADQTRQRIPSCLTLMLSTVKKYVKTCTEIHHWSHVTCYSVLFYADFTVAEKLSDTDSST